MLGQVSIPPSCSVFEAHVPHCAVKVSCSYYAAIIENQVYFVGRVVVDVGTGSGILSLFAAQAGAKHVYVVKASEMADYAQKLIAGNPLLAQRITVIKRKLEDIELPEKADILISEPMDGSVREGELDGVGGSDGSNGVCGSNEEGESTSIQVDGVEPDIVSLEIVNNGYQHSVKLKIVTAGSQIGKWPVINLNFKVTNLELKNGRGNTHGAGKSSDPIFALTRIPSTPSTATSYPPNAVDVLQKSFEELKKARARDKELFEEAKEENRKQYEEKLKSHALTMKKEMVKEANAKIAEMFAQYTQQLPIPHSPFLVKNMLCLIKLLIHCQSL
ncbi:probable histone-arginine methyltransferase 1.3 [Tanacetum coccineum]